jgi:hypothetical protein
LRAQQAVRIGNATICGAAFQHICVGELHKARATRQNKSQAKNFRSHDEHSSQKEAYHAF